MRLYLEQQRHQNALTVQTTVYGVRTPAIDSDGRGGNVMIFTGTALIDKDAPPAYEVSSYVHKYGEGFKRLQMTPERFAQTYFIRTRQRYG